MHRCSIMPFLPCRTHQMLMTTTAASESRRDSRSRTRTRWVRSIGDARTCRTPPIEWEVEDHHHGRRSSTRGDATSKRNRPIPRDEVRTTPSVVCSTSRVRSCTRSALSSRRRATTTAGGKGGDRSGGIRRHPADAGRIRNPHHRDDGCRFHFRFRRRRR